MSLASVTAVPSSNSEDSTVSLHDIPLATEPKAFTDDVDKSIAEVSKSDSSVSKSDTMKSSDKKVAVSCWRRHPRILISAAIVLATVIVLGSLAGWQVSLLTTTSANVSSVVIHPRCSDGSADTTQGLAGLVAQDMPSDAVYSTYVAIATRFDNPSVFSVEVNSCEAEFDIATSDEGDMMSRIGRITFANDKVVVGSGTSTPDVYLSLVFTDDDLTTLINLNVSTIKAKIKAQCDVHVIFGAISLPYHFDIPTQHFTASVSSITGKDTTAQAVSMELEGSSTSQANFLDALSERIHMSTIEMKDRVQGQLDEKSAYAFQFQGSIKIDLDVGLTISIMTNPMSFDIMTGYGSVGTLSVAASTMSFPSAKDAPFLATVIGDTTQMTNMVMLLADGAHLSSEVTLKPIDRTCKLESAVTAVALTTTTTTSGSTTTPTAGPDAPTSGSSTPASAEIKSVQITGDGGNGFKSVVSILLPFDGVFHGNFSLSNGWIKIDTPANLPGYGQPYDFLALVNGNQLDIVFTLPGPFSYFNMKVGNFFRDGLDASVAFVSRDHSVVYSQFTIGGCHDHIVTRSHINFDNSYDLAKPYSGTIETQKCSPNFLITSTGVDLMYHFSRFVSTNKLWDLLVFEQTYLTQAGWNYFRTAQQTDVYIRFVLPAVDGDVVNNALIPPSPLFAPDGNIRRSFNVSAQSKLPFAINIALQKDSLGAVDITIDSILPARLHVEGKVLAQGDKFLFNFGYVIYGANDLFTRMGSALSKFRYQHGHLKYSHWLFGTSAIHASLDTYSGISNPDQVWCDDRSSVVVTPTGPQEDLTPRLVTRVRTANRNFMYANFTGGTVWDLLRLESMSLAPFFTTFVTVDDRMISKVATFPVTIAYPVRHSGDQFVDLIALLNMQPPAGSTEPLYSCHRFNEIMASNLTAPNFNMWFDGIFNIAGATSTIPPRPRWAITKPDTDLRRVGSYTINPLHPLRDFTADVFVDSAQGDKFPLLKSEWRFKALEGIPILQPGFPVIDSVAEVTAVINVQLSLPGRLYYAVVPAPSTPPTVAALRAATVSGSVIATSLIIPRGFVTFKISMPNQLRGRTVYNFYAVAVGDAEGRLSDLVTAQFTTLDLSPPAFVSGPTVVAQGNSVTVSGSLTEPGRVWVYVTSVDAMTPTVAEIMHPTSNSFRAATSIEVGTALTFSVTTPSTLNSETSYLVYVLAADNNVPVPNVQATAVVLTTRTRDITPPVFSIGFPTVSDATTDSLTISVSMNEVGQVWLVVLAAPTSTTTPTTLPTVEQIRTATVPGALSSTMIDVLTVNTPFSFTTPHTLQARGVYRVVLVAADKAAPQPNFQTELTVLNTQTLGVEAVHDLTLVSTDAISATLTWTPVGAATQYSIQRRFRTAAESTFVQELLINSANIGQFTQNGKLVYVSQNLDSNRGFVWHVLSGDAIGINVVAGPGGTAAGFTLPRPPTQVTAVLGATSGVTVSWTAPADVESLITDYIIQFSRDGSKFTNPVTVLVGSAQTSKTFFHTAIVTGVTYFFRVQAKTAVGVSLNSLVSDGLLIARPPSAVQSVAAVKLSVTSVKITWAPPLNDGGLPIGGYIVSYSLVSSTSGSATAGSELVDVGKVLFGTNEFQADGLVPGSVLIFRVFAFSDAGKGEASLPSNVVVLASPPVAISAVFAAIYDPTSIRVMWLYPKNVDVGRPVTSFTLMVKKGGVVTLTQQLDSTVMTVLVSGLDNGGEYTFFVHATNDIGDGPDGSSSPLLLNLAADAPFALSAVQNACTEAKVSWKMPADSAPSVGGLVYWSNQLDFQGELSGAFPISPDSAPSLVTLVGQLPQGQTLFFMVSILNVQGVMSSNSTVSNNLLLACAPDAPGAPFVFTADAYSNVFVVPGDIRDGGSPLTGIRVFYKKQGDDQPTLGFEDLSDFAYITGLSGSTAYNFTVQAVNSIGASPMSAATLFTTDKAPPPPPTNLRLTSSTALTATSVSIQWDAPVGVTVYQYQVELLDSFFWFSVGVTSDLNMTIFDLVSNTPYSLRVSSTYIDSAFGQTTDELAIQTPVLLTPPAGVCLDDPFTIACFDYSVSGSCDAGIVTATTVAITYFETVSFSNPIDNHRIEVTDASANTVMKVVETTDTHLVVTGLSPGGLYTFRHAEHYTVGGWGDWSDPSPVMQAQFAAPSGLAAPEIRRLADTTASIKWAAPTSTGGAPISLFIVTVHPSAAADDSTDQTLYQSGDDSSATVVGLTAGAEYQVTMIALSLDACEGSSQPSPTLTFKTLLPAPTIVSFTASDPDNADAIFSNGDVLTIVFNIDTNQVDVSTQDKITALLSFSPGSTLGSSFSAAWTNARTLAITVNNIQGGALRLGASRVFVASKAGLTNADGTSAVCQAASGGLKGNWGVVAGFANAIAVPADPLKVYEDNAQGPTPVVGLSLGGELSVSEVFNVQVECFAGALAAVDQTGAPLTGASFTLRGTVAVLNAVFAATTFTYLPNKDFNGFDAVQVTIFQGTAAKAQSALFVRVLPTNDAPVIATPTGVGSDFVFSAGVFAQTALKFSVSDVDLGSSTSVDDIDPEWIAALGLSPADQGYLGKVSVNLFTWNQNGFAGLFRLSGSLIKSLEDTSADPIPSEDGSPYFTITGPPAQVNQVLQTITYESQTDTESYVIILVDDNSNVGWTPDFTDPTQFVTSGSMQAYLEMKVAPDTVNAPPPKLSTAVQTDTGSGFVVTFATAVFQDDSVPCDVTKFFAKETADQLATKFQVCVSQYANKDGTLTVTGQSCTDYFWPASCYWVNENQLAVDYGSRPSLSVGENVVLGSNIFKSFANSVKFSSGSAKLSSTASIPRPVATVSGIVNIGACDDLVLYGSCNNLGARDGLFKWSATNDLLRDLVGSGFGLTEMVIPGSRLTSNKVYNVSLACSNFLSSQGPLTTVQVTRVSVKRPTLTVNPTQLTLFRTAPFELEGVATPPDCDSGAEKVLNFVWSVDDDRVVLDASTKTTPRLFVPANSLTPGKYKFTLKVSLAVDATRFATTSAVVTISQQAPVATVNNPTASSQSRAAAIALDASPSVDPDTGDQSTLTYAWRCQSITGTAATARGKCVNVNTKAEVTLGTTAIVNLAGGLLAAGDYEFAVTVTKTKGTFTATDKAVFVVSLAKSLPPLVNVDNDVDVINTDGLVRVTCIAKPGEKTTTIASYKWTAGGSTPFDITNKDLVDGDLTSPALIINPKHKDTFLAGTRLELICTVTDSANTQGFARARVIINAPPSKGRLQVSPASGLVGFTTPVSLSAIGFKSFDANGNDRTSQLSFQFFAVDPVTKEEQPLSPRGFNPQVKLPYLPSGEADFKNSYDIIVRCVDRYNAVASAAIKVTVADPAAGFDPTSKIDDVFGDLKNEQNSGKALAQLAMLSGQLSGRPAGSRSGITMQAAASKTDATAKVISGIRAIVKGRVNELQTASSLGQATDQPANLNDAATADSLATILALLATRRDAKPSQRDVLNTNKVYTTVLSNALAARVRLLSTGAVSEADGAAAVATTVSTTPDQFESVMLSMFSAYEIDNMKLAGESGQFASSNNNLQGLVRRHTRASMAGSFAVISTPATSAVTATFAAGTTVTSTSVLTSLLDTRHIYYDKSVQPYAANANLVSGVIAFSMANTTAANLNGLSLSAPLQFAFTLQKSACLDSGACSPACYAYDKATQTWSSTGAVVKTAPLTANNDAVVTCQVTGAAIFGVATFTRTLTITSLVAAGQLTGVVHTALPISVQLAAGSGPFVTNDKIALRTRAGTCSTVSSTANTILVFANGAWKKDGTGAANSLTPPTRGDFRICVSAAPSTAFVDPTNVNLVTALFTPAVGATVNAVSSLVSGGVQARFQFGAAVTLSIQADEAVPFDRIQLRKSTDDCATLVPNTELEFQGGSNWLRVGTVNTFNSLPATLAVGTYGVCVRPVGLSAYAAQTSALGVTLTITPGAPAEVVSVRLNSNNARGLFNKAKPGDSVTVSVLMKQAINTPTCTILDTAATCTQIGTTGLSWNCSRVIATAGTTTTAVTFAFTYSVTSGTASSTLTSTTDSSQVLYDPVAPVLTSVLFIATTGEAYKTQPNVPLKITMVSSKALSTPPVVTIDGNSATVTGSGTSFIATVTPTSFTVAKGSNIPFSVSGYYDQVGNLGATVTAPTDNNNVVYTDPTTTPPDNSAPKPAVQVTLKLNLVFDTCCSTAAGLTQFATQFVADVENAGAQFKGRVRFGKATAGSVVVQFTLTPSQSASDPSSASLLSDLQTQVNTPGSAFLSGSLTSATDTTSLTSTTVQMSFCAATNQYEVVGTCNSGGGSSGLSAGALAGIIIGVLAGVGIVAFVVFRFCHKSNGKYSCGSNGKVSPADGPIVNEPSANEECSKPVPGSPHHGSDAGAVHKLSVEK